jgi:hypothetical protein
MSNAVFAEEHIVPTLEVREKVRGHYDRGARLGLVSGGLGLGAMIGFVAALAIGYSEWSLNAVGAGGFVIVFALTMMNLRHAIDEHAYGCAALTALHICALIAWLAMSGQPYGPPLAVSVPTLATLLLFASCWTRSDGGVYRTALQAIVVGVVASAQFLSLAIGA